MFRALADIFRTAAYAVPSVAKLPLRLAARLFGGLSRSPHGRH